jgi:hypothetical protein
MLRLEKRQTIKLIVLIVQHGEVRLARMIAKPKISLRRGSSGSGLISLNRIPQCLALKRPTGS